MAPKVLRGFTWKYVNLPWAAEGDRTLEQPDRIAAQHEFSVPGGDKGHHDGPLIAGAFADLDRATRMLRRVAQVAADDLDPPEIGCHGRQGA